MGQIRLENKNEERSLHSETQLANAGTIQNY